MEKLLLRCKMARALLNEQGFELGRDMEIHDFIGVKIGAVNSIVFDDGSVFNSKFRQMKNSVMGGPLSNKPEQLSGSIKLMGASRNMIILVVPRSRTSLYLAM